MYVPSHFAETDTATLHDFMERNSFALVTSRTTDSLVASHLPLLLERNVGPHGRLVGHFARANSHWREAIGETLVVFSGPHAYVAPTWYEAENVVPTWNYVAVHAYGTLRLIEEQDALIEILQRTVSLYESAMPAPWSFDANSDFIRKLATMVVGFRIDISRLDGKWKLNQNHPQERREKVIRVLGERDDENSQAIANLMRETDSR